MSVSKYVLGFPGSLAVSNLPAMQETPVYFWVRKIPWRRDRLPTPVFLGFPGGSTGKESACNEGDPGLIPGLEDLLEEGMAIHYRRHRLHTPVFLGFPSGSASKESACIVGDLCSIPGVGNPLEKGPTTQSSILAW